MKIYGIDPAPRKDNVVFDGKSFQKYNVERLKSFIESLDKDTLICWDAPLSFDMKTFNFYYRPVEYFFRYKKKLPPGVSVLPIAGCSHWLMSEYVIGYPSLYCKREDISLVLKREDLNIQKIKLIEVHPALAIWIWLKGKRENFQYKKGENKKEILKEIVDELKELKIIKDMKINIDDELDAYISWKLGEMFLNTPYKTMILGDESGYFLLPFDEKIKKDFETFKGEKNAKQVFGGY